MAWRVFNGLLVLRDQVNKIAPNRAKGADGTICDENHPTTSDHCPHDVPGVGSEMVSALDLTHDPAGGFDSYKFAEVLRQHRDPRIKYVISNTRMFSSYATSSYAAWTWRPYSGTDPHTGHVHISVLDAAISDTSTPWNLEGFIPVADSLITYNTGWMVQLGIMELDDPVVIPKNSAIANSGSTLPNQLAKKLIALEAKLDEINGKLDQLLSQGGGSATTGPTYHFEGTATPQV
jgi:hypothetical protein